MLGIVTIGQTPRPDIERACRSYAGATAIRIAGALDGLTREEVRHLENRDGPYPLLVRLADGRIASRIQSSITVRAHHRRERKPS